MQPRGGVPAWPHVARALAAARKALTVEILVSFGLPFANMQTRLSHVEVMLGTSAALGVAAWFGESKLWDYAFIASLALLVVVLALRLIKGKGR